MNFANGFDKHLCINVFLQPSSKDIAILPEIFKEKKIKDIPELLSESRASSTVKTNYIGFPKMECLDTEKRIMA